MASALSGDYRAIDIREVELMSDVLSQLCYPAGNLEYSRVVLDSLKKLQVDELYVDDSNRLVILGKGFRNIVITCGGRGQMIAAKIRRFDYVSTDTSKEVSIHRLANSVGVGPRLIGAHGPIILMELVRGVDITKWMLSLSFTNRGEALLKIDDLLSQCHRLDSAKINHDELSNATRHVLVRGEGVTIIDFGSASISAKPTNVTSIIHYLFHGPVANVSRDVLGLREPPLEILRRYKNRHAASDFHLLRRLLTNL